MWLSGLSLALIGVYQSAGHRELILTCFRAQKLLSCGDVEGPHQA
jgi:hypothetical protein